MTSDERVAQQLQDVVEIGPKAVLVRMFNRSLGERHGYLAGGGGGAEAPGAATDPPVGSKRFKHIKDKGKGKKSKPQEPSQTEEEDTTGLGLLKPPLVIIQSMSIGR